MGKAEERGIRVSALRVGAEVEVVVAAGTAAAKTLEKEKGTKTKRGRERGAGRGSTDTGGADVIAGATVAAGVRVGMYLAVCGTAAGTRCSPMRTSVEAGSWTCTGKDEKREKTEVSTVGRESLTEGRTAGL